MKFFRSAAAKRLTPLIGSLVILAALAIILISGQPVISHSAIEHKLQQFGAFVSAEAALDGREGTFTYGNVTVSGWGFNRSATIDNVSLEIAQKAILERRRWSLSTTRVLVKPDPTHSGRLLFAFPDPINVIENSQLETTISFPSPPVYSYFDGSVRGVHTVEHVLELPSQVMLTPANTAEPTDEKNQRITISYDDHPTVKVTVLPQKGERHAQYEFHNIRVLSDNGIEGVAAMLSSRFSEAPDGKGNTAGEYQLQVTDLALHEKDVATHTYNISADVAFSGDQPVKPEAAQALLPPGKLHMALKNLGISSADFKVSAAGTLDLAPDDPLPFGDVTVAIDNAQAFADSELVPERARQPLLAALQKATGQPAATLTQVTLPVKRDKNGVLYVGNVTFEELATSMLADMMKPAAAPPPLPPSPPSAPSLPPGTK